jgi:putative ABC transport system permease protein
MVAGRSLLRLARKKVLAHLPQLAGFVLLLTVGMCFFMTLFTIALRYEETAEQFFEDLSYADATYYGTFDAKQVKTLNEQDAVLSAEGRTVRDYREEGRFYRAISLTETVNALHIYEGRLPREKDECLLLRRNALALGLSLGDAIKIDGKSLTITGLAAAPEYVYLVQNERTTMAHPEQFVVLYVSEDFYPAGFNELVVRIDAGEATRDYSGMINAFRVVFQKDQPNYALYRSDLEQLRSFAYIFPGIFVALIAVVIYVMLRRTIQKERRQIGAMKALGVSDARIISVYLAQFCLAAFMGALLGCVLAAPVSAGIISILSSMFEVPALSFAVYPGLWTGAILTAILLGAVSALVALQDVLSLTPASAMRPQAPKGGRHRVLEEQRGTASLQTSFNTRYALKSALRNKGRFVAVVLGMCGSCALLVFSFGFSNSIDNTQRKYFEEFARYDVIVNLTPLSLSEEHPAAKEMDESTKVLLLPVEIENGNYMLAITEDGFDMVAIPREALNRGFILPEYFALQWRVGVGDTLRVDGHDVEVSAVVAQYLGPMLYTSHRYVGTVTDEIPATYNTLFGRSADLAALSAYLNKNGLSFATIEDDRNSFKSIMESMSVLIWFMISCSIVLGFTVLYSVGLITLSAREYEYMFMGVMGYPHRSILLAQAKETTLQFFLATPLGFILGWVLLESIKGEFSNNSFVVAPLIEPQSFALAAALVIGVAALMLLVISRHVSKLDIVEGLKTQDV